MRPVADDDRTGDIQLTRAEAAAEVGVRPGTIDTWTHRGYLRSIPGTRPRKWWLSDVLLAESARKRSMRRSAPG